MESNWWRIAETGQLMEGSRLHSCVEGRYVTIFRRHGKLCAIDSICHHAGGPMTLGAMRDIEELGGLTVVLCPWHKFMVSIDGGVKVYEAVEFVNNKPVKAGWKTGKVVQRPHDVLEKDGVVFLRLNKSAELIGSDVDACKELCAHPFTLQPPPVPVTFSL